MQPTCPPPPPPPAGASRRSHGPPPPRLSAAAPRGGAAPGHHAHYFNKYGIKKTSVFCTLFVIYIPMLTFICIYMYDMFHQ